MSESVDVTKPTDKPSLERVADDLALARDLLAGLASDLDALLEKRTDVALARVVFDRLLACVYDAADSSDYHGGGGDGKVEAIIAEVREMVEAAEANNGGTP